ncbi:hypothetical protein BDV38DRAFT_284053 [Aspergillus pseudotamarii]|uniref:G domain-containing protein n=1 Tax=Aspergillus pseudotamarii TaxID=132259 RepID=A0A5N6SQX5_ASPPS|nr:uncharacterized protein BDV38DRAFT_284053 [Aspergillus pseudotamarii]KAE8136307.1 hypothetical protein BDV38DRAFT_284053 [Aspergillus pseudotamarii]
MGMTGVGKTTFIGTLTDSDLTVGYGLNSGMLCSQHKARRTSTSSKRSSTDRRSILLITSGFDDTDLSDTETLKTIAAYLQGAERANIQLTWLLLPAPDQRCADARKCVEEHPHV